MIEINSAGLKAGLKHLGLEVDESVADKFLRYAALLVRWNKTYNLTAISNASDVLTHHLLDSAALVPELKRLCPDARTVLDVGSGGGLPAVPVALLCPELKVLAVDCGRQEDGLHQSGGDRTRSPEPAGAAHARRSPARQGDLRRRHVACVCHARRLHRSHARVARSGRPVARHEGRLSAGGNRRARPLRERRRSSPSADSRPGCRTARRPHA